MFKIRLKNGSYGFIYSEAMPTDEYTEKAIKIDPGQIAITMDYSEYAENHCACVCAMNILTILKKDNAFDLKDCEVEKDRDTLFKKLHGIVKNGPVVFFKPKLKKIFKSIGSNVRYKKAKGLEDFEQCIAENKPVAMMVNAGITKWHWITVIGIRKYKDGAIYLNILDGWNKRTDRYLKYNGRETYIRALKPELKPSP